MENGAAASVTCSVQVRAVAGLGLVVLGTFGILWAPWLGSWAEARQVLVRLIPLSRGIFEDYVANFWCVSNVVVKWKLRLTQQVRSCRHPAQVLEMRLMPHKPYRL